MQLKDYIASNLNEEQTAAALHTDTSSLIIAWAWSWKTRVLTYKIAYLIWWKNIPVERILWVTFTNKAANEMKERLVKLGDDIAQQTFNEEEKDTEKSSDSDFNEFIDSIQKAPKKWAKPLDIRKLKWIWTFHSIFLKILKEDIEALWMKYNKNFWILDADDSSKIIKDLLKRLNLKEMIKPVDAKAFISTQKNNWRTADYFLLSAWNTNEQMMWKLYKEYEKELEKSNSLDFDDLLLLPYLLFRKDTKILEKWQHAFDYILVDEAQDTNWIQFELMKMLSWAWANITLIWDDFQSIYWWRGALMENFLNVKRYWNDIKMFKLQINYRSKAHIVEAWNQVIKNNKNQYEKNIIANREWSDKIAVLTSNTDTDEAANIIELIKQMKEKWKLKSWWQVAILYRTNSQSSNFESLFIQEWIPYKIYWAFKFFDRIEIKDILAYLRIVNNPFDSVSLKRVLNIPNRKIWATSLERIEEYASNMWVSLFEVLTFINEVWDVKTLENEGNLKVTSAVIAWVKDFMTLYNELLESVKKLNPADLINTLIKKINYKDYLVKQEWWEEKADERYQNVGQLINMASKYDFWMSNQNEEIVSSWEDLLRWFLEEVTLMVDAIENSDETSDAVKLMTIHSSKWLEFPAVFIVWAEENVFPLSRASLDPKELEEERRLMYVAITRAKDALFISHANERMTWGQVSMNPISRFVQEISDDLLKFFDLTKNWWTRTETYSISEWDMVRHKLFWNWYVLEIWNNMAIVKFENPKFWLRKIELRFLQQI